MSTRSIGTRVKKANPVNVSNILVSVLKDLQFESEINFEQLKKKWNEIVGAIWAKNTEPLKLDNGILTVAVSSPMWLTQAHFSKNKFMENINNSESLNIESVRDIIFILDKS
ncbi:MAG: DUF721 domain-containing protein [Candidatus Latescibacteria bacterium]|nr:DUF721 domain-containing protein [Candidatus Latescibacterota bacterium]